MTASIAEVYGARFSSLQQVAENLESFIRELLKDLPRIDSVSSRAKEPGRFAAKAEKVDEDGTARYHDPVAQIQDQIGARVVVFYKSDVTTVEERLRRYFQPLEHKELVPESHWEFGYFGHHWIFALPDDVVPESVEKHVIPRFFELQVKTLFQHAWSEANHDVAYKPLIEPTADQERRFAYTAAQAWGADRVFEELWRELNGSDGEGRQPERES